MSETTPTLGTVVSNPFIGTIDDSKNVPCPTCGEPAGNECDTRQPSDINWVHSTRRILYTELVAQLDAQPHILFLDEF